MSYFNLNGKLEGHTDGNKLIISIGSRKPKRVVLSDDEALSLAAMAKGVVNDFLKRGKERESPKKFDHLKISPRLVDTRHLVLCDVSDGQADEHYTFSVYVSDTPQKFHGDTFYINGYVYPPQWSRGCYKYDWLLPCLSTGCGPISREIIENKSFNLIEFAAMKMVKMYITLHGHDMQFSDTSRHNPFEGD